MKLDKYHIGPKFYKQETKRHQKVIRFLRKHRNSKSMEYASPIRIKSVASER